MSDPFWSGKRVLVTGGSGFLGRRMRNVLGNRGANVWTADLPQVDLSLDCRTYFAKCQPDVVLHLAGMPGVRQCDLDWDGAFRANVVTTANVLEAARRSVVVVVSSNHVYGPQAIQPTPETAALSGRGVYAATKAAADLLAQSYGKTYGVPVGVARITNTYGPDDHHAEHLVTSTIKRCLAGQVPVITGSGCDRKGFAYIDDTCEGILAVAEGVAAKPELRGEAFNIVPRESPTTLELVKLVAATCGCHETPVIERPFEFSECEHLDNTKARELLGWQPRYTLADGIAETVNWYREQLCPAR